MAKESKNYPPNINDERDVRLKKMQDLCDRGYDPFPSESHKKNTVLQALSKPPETRVSVAGRIMLKREMGKIAFAQVHDQSGNIQIVLKLGDIEEEAFKTFVKKIDAGDIIEVMGTRFQTQSGQESILVQSWTLLAKALRPLPDKVHGLQDEELKLRKRYLDLMTDPELRDVFYRKAIFWSSMREFLVKRDFLEVETPVLEASAGGADATPFMTHHNALDMDVYLRISMGELWQKRLMVAGFEKTFEIGRQFRNEGMSREHLQDYMQMEFYWAYANYKDSMKLVQKMYQHVIKKTYGSLQFSAIGTFQDIDLSGSWGTIDYRSTIKEHTGIDILKAKNDAIRKTLGELNVTFQDNEGRGRLIDSLWKFCRKQIKGPVFLINLPVEVSPLAKRQKKNSSLTERYQIIIAGSELGNGYTELNDPIDQAARFDDQSALREAGDTEAQMHDHDFVEALEYGMPPTTGFGVSERLFSFLENRPIRECVLFPLVKPKQEE
ncbi:MAG: lysine--tRNA ligase [Candidatus Magasanikbacteria bacterium CG10_big_fil_rev_8_21_14_0_10_47_10]|uniref:Lysine--tRNA ligase n=1 Tax=Candidatus Magasanikbacteria bacterium CG10_big_fil_rev_8_21_14_0_10_47_10 TaxID=1974652 RepID=A0A2H0TQR9_9BACT|nr:MAG: lysine--tRNA ligase [Candidatus Magasanikbacteria bacterium CG10_big_fil_rev_8_21_14_0_10_47_10]